MHATLVSILTLWASIAWAPRTVAEDLPRMTYTFKSVGDLEIKADVVTTSEATAGPHPVVIYLHGGSLVGGSREKLFKKEFPLKNLFLETGCVLVSIDYRRAQGQTVTRFAGNH